uniref:Uncharacterized protein n=1 Tax=Romanomermis culicivorax TaxID=13658 RepID=A0A915L301_ROMCU
MFYEHKISFERDFLNIIGLEQCKSHHKKNKHISEIRDLNDQYEDAIWVGQQRSSSTSKSWQHREKSSGRACLIVSLWQHRYRAEKMNKKYVRLDLRRAGLMIFNRGKC